MSASAATPESRNIVVLGASFAGLGLAHYIMRHVLPAVIAAEPTVSYKLVLVNPSSHFWWRIGAPRALVDASLVKHADSFKPIVDGFTQYANTVTTPSPSGQGRDPAFSFIQAEATALDITGRTVTLKPTSGSATEPNVLPYYALVIATGISTPSPVTTQVGSHTSTQAALDAMNARLRTATRVVIGGSGPVAVETAGEIAELFKARGAGAEKGSITLVSGGKRLLPVLRPALAEKAAKQLAALGVEILRETRVERVDAGATPDAESTVHLSSGAVLPADVYIAGTGVTPNAAFVPEALRNARGYVKADKATLRVPGAGDRVFVLGDVGDHSRGGALAIQAAVPVVGANLKADLLGRKADERKFTVADVETQLVPVGRKTGVGAFNGWKLPGMMVHMIKGKDYMVGRIPPLTGGAQYAKA